MTCGKTLSGSPVIPMWPILPSLLSSTSAEGLADDLVEVGELDVVALQQVDMVDSEPCATFVQAADCAGGAEVELAGPGLSDLRRQKIAVAGHSLERLPQNCHLAEKS